MDSQTEQLTRALALATIRDMPDIQNIDGGALADALRNLNLDGPLTLEGASGTSGGQLPAEGSH